MMRLTLRDYCGPNWPEIELCEEEPSYRAFWAAVLQLATADGASIVRYELDSGESCLSVEIEDNRFAMEPPPAALRRQLLRAAERYAFGRLRSVLGTWTGRRAGTIVVETPLGDVRWNVREIKSGVWLTRVA